MRSIIYPKAGKIVLVRYNADGTLTPDADKMIAGNGTVQAIRPSVTINTAELADGNSDWPMGVYDTGKTGQVEVTMSSFQPALYAALMGATLEVLAQTDLWAAEEEKTIPSASPYTASLLHSPKAGGTIVVVNEEASPLVSVGSNPAVGQFSVSGSTVTFNSLDAGKTVFVTYEWQASDVNKLGLPEVGSRPVLHAIISTEATDEDEINTYDANIIVDKCKATGDLNAPQQQREPQSWSFTLRVLKPRPGYNPVYWKFARRA